MEKWKRRGAVGREGGNGGARHTHEQHGRAGNEYCLPNRTGGSCCYAMSGSGCGVAAKGGVVGDGWEEGEGGGRGD